VRALLLAISLLLWFYYAPFLFFYFEFLSRQIQLHCVPSTGIKNQPHRFEIVAISSVDEDILASCNVVVVVAGHREIDSSRTEKNIQQNLGCFR
jgi:hypothetical protein